MTASGSPLGTDPAGQPAAGEPAPPMPGLQPVCDVHVTVGTPEDHGVTRVGHRRVIPVIGGTITGALEAQLLPGGADWQVIRADGAIEIDARYSARTDAGELVDIRTVGVRSAPAEVLERLGRGETVDPREYYFRASVMFETSAPGLRHLQDSVFVSSNRRDVDGVRYRVYRLS